MGRGFAACTAPTVPTISSVRLTEPIRSDRVWLTLAANLPREKVQKRPLELVAEACKDFTTSHCTRHRAVSSAADKLVVGLIGEVHAFQR